MKTFSEESSLHGVKYIFSSNKLKISQIFWSIALILSFFGFSFYIYSAYQKWQFVSIIEKLKVLLEDSKKKSIFTLFKTKNFILCFIPKLVLLANLEKCLICF